jgi:hypothetical protein
LEKSKSYEAPHYAALSRTGVNINIQLNETGSYIKK